MRLPETPEAAVSLEMSDLTENQSFLEPENSYDPASKHPNIRGRASPGFQWHLFGQGPAISSGFLQAMRSWAPEIACCVIGILAMGAIMVILFWVDGKPQPELPLGITLNSLIQLLISIAKFSFTVPLFSGLGQLKWLWFTISARPLMDFQLFEDAGHGGLGSIKLLFKLNGLSKRPLAGLAAIVIISGFLTSPVTQQAITYPSHGFPLTNGTASIAKATTFSRSNGTGFVSVHGDELTIEDAILHAAYLGPNQTLQGVDPLCSTADCTWPTYGSLGVCVDVINVTSILNGTLRSSIETFGPGQLPLSSYAAVMIPFPTPSHLFNESLTKAAFSESWIAFTKTPINITEKPDISDFQYLDVLFYFCAKSFMSDVTAGIPRTLEISSTANMLSSPASSLNLAWNQEFNNNDICNNTTDGLSAVLDGPSGLNETYAIDFCTALLFSDFFDSVIGGGILEKEDLSSAVYFSGQISTALGVSIFGDYLRPNMWDSPSQFQNIKSMMENIAESLTKFIRESGSTFTGGNGTVTGTAFAPQTIVKIRWAWLTLLGSQLILATAFIAATIVAAHSSGMQILKESPLATICALDQTAKDGLGTVRDLRTLEEKAEKLKVKLERGGSGTGGMIRND